MARRLRRPNMPPRSVAGAYFDLPRLPRSQAPHGRPPPVSHRSCGYASLASRSDPARRPIRQTQPQRASRRDGLDHSVEACNSHLSTGQSNSADQSTRPPCCQVVGSPRATTGHPAFARATDRLAIYKSARRSMMHFSIRLRQSWRRLRQRICVAEARLSASSVQGSSGRSRSPSLQGLLTSQGAPLQEVLSRHAGPS